MACLPPLTPAPSCPARRLAGRLELPARPAPSFLPNSRSRRPLRKVILSRRTRTILPLPTSRCPPIATSQPNSSSSNRQLLARLTAQTNLELLRLHPLNLPRRRLNDLLSHALPSIFPRPRQLLSLQTPPLLLPAFNAQTPLSFDLFLPFLAVRRLPERPLTQLPDRRARHRVRLISNRRWMVCQERHRTRRFSRARRRWTTRWRRYEAEGSGACRSRRDRLCPRWRVSRRPPVLPSSSVSSFNRFPSFHLPSNPPLLLFTEFRFTKLTASYDRLLHLLPFLP
jgi:hypothetical protein